jgi:IS30 family transposase
LRVNRDHLQLHLCPTRWATQEELDTSLCHVRNKRVPRSKGQDRRGQIPDMLGMAHPMLHSMTYDQGREMALHKDVSHNTGIAVYFSDPHTPWQRGSNENMNGLISQYLLKGTHLSVYSKAKLDDIADQINNRPRQGLRVRSPMKVYTELLSNSQQHSTLIH